MKQQYLLRAQVETTEHQLVDYAILEAKSGSLRLITSRFKGTALGGLILLGIASIYYGLLASPFVFFRAPPIQTWGTAALVLFAAALPLGFVTIVTIGLRFIQPIQIRYPKTTRSVKVLNVRPGKFRHELTVESNGDTFLLTITSRRSNLLDAIATGDGPSPKRTFGMGEQTFR